MRSAAICAVGLAISAKASISGGFELPLCLDDRAEIGSFPQDIVKNRIKPARRSCGRKAHMRILEIVTWLPEQLNGSTRPRVLASFSPTTAEMTFSFISAP